jgi:hypothetical protein
MSGLGYIRRQWAVIFMPKILLRKVRGRKIKVIHFPASQKL